MPKNLINHCAVPIGNKIYVHGGFESKNAANRETFILDVPTKTWETISVGPDCGIPPVDYMTTCAIWNNQSMVVPTFDTKTENTCTAILDLKTNTWTKLKVDGRHQLIAGGSLFS